MNSTILELDHDHHCLTISFDKKITCCLLEKIISKMHFFHVGWLLARCILPCNGLWLLAFYSEKQKLEFYAYFFVKSAISTDLHADSKMLFHFHILSWLFVFNYHQMNEMTIEQQLWFIFFPIQWSSHVLLLRKTVSCFDENRVMCFVRITTRSKVNFWNGCSFEVPTKELQKLWQLLRPRAAAQLLTDNTVVIFL